VNIDGEYLVDQGSGSFVCLRCGGLVAVIGRHLHTWNHRLLAGWSEKDLGPRPTIG
jgi:hypothetical protein